MREIILKMDSPTEAAQFASVLFQNGFKAQKAIINYNIRRNSVKIKKLSDYPLILEGMLNGHEMRVAIAPLAIGNFSEGSCALRKILKTANFYVVEKDLFTLSRFNTQTGIASFCLLQK